MTPVQLTAFRDEYTKLAAKKMSIKKMKKLISKKLFGSIPKDKSVRLAALKGAAKGAALGGRSGAALGAGFGAMSFDKPLRDMITSGSIGGLAGVLGGAGVGGISGALKTRAANKSALKEFMAAKGAKKQEMTRQALLLSGAVGGGATLGALLNKGKKS